MNKTKHVDKHALNSQKLYHRVRVKFLNRACIILDTTVTRLVIWFLITSQCNNVNEARVWGDLRADKSVRVQGGLEVP